MACQTCKKPKNNVASLLEAAKTRARNYGQKHGINEIIIVAKQDNYGFQTVAENEACQCPIVDRVYIL